MTTPDQAADLVQVQVLGARLVALVHQAHIPLAVN